MRYSSLRVTEKLYSKIQLLFTSMEWEFVLLILVLYTVSLLATVWTLLPAWEVWLYLKLKSNSLVWKRWDSTHQLFLTASLFLTYRTQQCSTLMVQYWTYKQHCLSRFLLCHKKTTLLLHYLSVRFHIFTKRRYYSEFFKNLFLVASNWTLYQHCKMEKDIL